MRILILVIIAILTIFTSCKNRKNEIFEISPESIETQSIIDIKQFSECAKMIKDFPNYDNFLKVLGHKKGYQKQLEYIKRVIPHNKDATLCKKSARKVVPKYLDIQQFAL